MFKNKYFYIALLGLLLAVFWQESNLLLLQNNFPVKNGLLTSQDEASYLRPPQNLLAIGEWKDSSNGVTSYFFRPPGFGIYFLILKFLFGNKVWFVLKLVQITLFFLSILLFSKILKFFQLSEKIRFLFVCLYAFLPAYSGFMYFTITESITPFITLLTLYLWLKSTQKLTKYLTYFIVSGAYLIILRPQLIIFVVLFILYFLFRKHYKAFLISLLCFIPLIVWNIRSVYYSNGEWLGLHPVYSKTNNSLFRPPHEAMTNLFKVWEYRSDVFHETIQLLAEDSSTHNLKLALANVPLNYQAQVSSVFRDFQKLEFKRQQLPKDLKINKLLEGEQDFVFKTNRTFVKLKSEHKIDYYLITPLKSFKELSFNSHLNLYSFQAVYRGKIWCEIFRVSCFLLISISICLAFLLLLKKQSLDKIVITLGLILTVGYFSFVQRLNEERYLTPLLPVFLLMTATFFVKTENDDKGNELEKFS